MQGARSSSWPSAIVSTRLHDEPPRSQRGTAGLPSTSAPTRRSNIHEPMSRRRAAGRGRNVDCWCCRSYTPKEYSMGIFSRILDRLRHHGSASASQQPPEQQGSTQQQPQYAQQSGQAQQQAQPSAQAGLQGHAQTLQNVDIDAVLAQLAQQKGGGGN